MSTYCSVHGCGNNSTVPGITFHNFPRNEQKRADWIAALNQTYWTPKKSSRICSKHFKEEDIDRTSLCLVRIRQNAKPTLFPANPYYAPPAYRLAQMSGKPSRKIKGSPPSPPPEQPPQPYVEQPPATSHEQPSLEQPSHEQPSLEQPSLEQPSHEQPLAEKRGFINPTTAKKLKTKLFKREQALKLERQRTFRLRKQLAKMTSLVDDLRQKLESKSDTAQCSVKRKVNKAQGTKQTKKSEE
ncbi:hypothetical protein M8J75_004523 [Diaphorina citri]|nr:hypothetical protein M8J75_004523 [Diaphorina citri]